jgi:hypothetical protein
MAMSGRCSTVEDAQQEFERLNDNSEMLLKQKGLDKNFRQISKPAFTGLKFKAVWHNNKTTPLLDLYDQSVHLEQSGPVHRQTRDSIDNLVQLCNKELSTVKKKTTIDVNRCLV